MRQNRRRSLRPFLVWASSFGGHLVIFQVIWTLPMWGLFCWLRHEEGTLNVTSAAKLLFYAALAGIAFTILFWFTVSSPLRQRTNRTSE